MKEDLREKVQDESWKTGNIETEANELLRGNKIDVPTWVRVRNLFLKLCSKQCSINSVQNRVQKLKKIANKNMSFLKILRRETL